jgi:competence protein ComEA
MSRVVVGLMIAGTALCASGQTSPATNKLPDGKGQQETARICTACHTIDNVVSERHDRAGWQKLVDDMAARGADGTDQQFALIVDYLTKNFGPKPSNTD